MKSFKFILSAALIGLLFSYSGCKKKTTDPDPKDVQIGKLSATWKIKTGEAKLDGSAQTGYDNFILTASGTAGQTSFGYTCSGRPALSPWPASGTFTFGTDFATQIVRDDALPITYSATDTQLQLSFNYSGAGIAGRVSNVKGNWVYTFTKQ